MTYLVRPTEAGLAKVLAFMANRNLEFRVIRIDERGIAIGDDKYGTAIVLPRELEKKFPVGATVTAFRYFETGEGGLVVQSGDHMDVVVLLQLEEVYGGKA